MITRPTDERINWSPSETDVEVPSGTKQSLGFILREKFGSKVANGLFKRLCQWLNFAVDRVDAHETVANVTFDLAVDDIADIQTFFDELKHNDYTITLTGTYDDNTTVLSITNISGIGNIVFSGNVTMGGVLVSGVNNSVRFNGELNVEQTTQYGLRVVNSPYVYVNELNCTFESAPTSAWCLVRLENGKLTCLTPDFDGRFTSASAPTYLIRLDSKSQILLGTDYNVKTNAIAGSAIGRSMIQVDDGGLFDTSAEALFDANWGQNYACQLEMVKYPKSEQIYYINTETGLTYAKAIINGIIEVNCAIDSVGINNNISDLTIENISGSGSITLNSATFVLDNIIRNCTCDINITDVEVKENNISDIKYGLSVINCINVNFLTQTILDVGTELYGGLFVNNSKCYFEDLRNTNTYTIGGILKLHPSYFKINNSSDIYIDRILSGDDVRTTSDFISLMSGSKLSLKSWVSSNVHTTGLGFNEIDEASYVVGYTSANKYILATTPSDITIIELP